MIIDSQAVKNTCNAGIDSKGFCFYKSTNGIKRHLAVDTMGFPAWCAFPCACRRRGVASAFFTHCTKASLSDDLGLIEMLIDNINYFKSKPVNIPKITIDADKSFLLDHGYHPRKLQEAFFRSLSWYYAKN